MAIKRDLMFCSLGNGISVCDTLHEKNGDYLPVAHIASDRTITWYLKTLDPEYRKAIEEYAVTADPVRNNPAWPHNRVFNTRPNQS